METRQDHHAKIHFKQHSSIYTSACSANMCWCLLPKALEKKTRTKDVKKRFSIRCGRQTGRIPCYTQDLENILSAGLIKITVGQVPQRKSASALTLAN